MAMHEEGFVPFLWPLTYSHLEILWFVLRQDSHTFCSVLLSIPAEIAQLVNQDVSNFYPRTVALHQKYIRGPFIDVLGYGEVVLSNFRWSNCDSISIAGKEIHHGLWTVHALEVVPVTYSNDNNIMNDISGKVAREMAEIWHRRK
ncbi:hypothetical protein CIHG_10455 [Coccidioides immitis H538.4]|uniref:Uncharacterized protein n=1 Tax=Coccidioides immitis H538.4 TaxID=396776 RepID=A0A0J8S5B2_COCIT|nr:hypothetical protein CIHG_10455 [Coccidioides immitis H538.4]